MLNPHVDIRYRVTVGTILTNTLVGEIPCHSAVKNDHVRAFMTMAPMDARHTFMVPKERKAGPHGLGGGAAATLRRPLPRIPRVPHGLYPDALILPSHRGAAHRWHVLVEPPA